MIPGRIVHTQPHETSGTAGRTPAAPSAAAPSGSNRTPAAASPAATSPAGSMAVPSPNRAPRNPPSALQAPPQPTLGSTAEDDRAGPAPPGPHRRTRPPIACPNPASRLSQTASEESESRRVQPRYRLLQQPARARRGDGSPAAGGLRTAALSRKPSVEIAEGVGRGARLGRAGYRRAKFALTELTWMIHAQYGMAMVAPREEQK